MHMQSAAHHRVRLSTWAWPLVAIAVAVVAMACGPATPTTLQPTPDYHALETRVESMLRATYTAMAPPATPTPEPTETATPGPETSLTLAPATPTPFVLSDLYQLAYVQGGPEGESSIVLEGVLPQDRVVLSRLAGPDAITDLAWSSDGKSLLFVSGYNALLSRRNERNLFVVRSDGSGLRMITGGYVPADKAPGPYVTLEGRVVGAQGDCLVSAQGISSPVSIEDTGNFVISGVPIGATWARAVCTADGRTLAGDTTIAAAGGVFPPTRIQVVEGGQGWKQADLSRNGAVLAGTYYRWGLGQEAADDTATANGERPASVEPDGEGGANYRFWGRIRGLESGYEADLETVQQGDLNGVDWSPVDDLLVGALTGGDGGWLWLWDATGASVGELYQMPNPDDQILTLANPSWSPDGRQLVFEARRWYWWGENRYRTDLMLVSGDGQTVQTLVESAWGEHASEPGWMPDGDTIVYQYVRTAPDRDLASADNGSIWMVQVSTGLRLPWTSGPDDRAPAPFPASGARPTPQAEPPATTD